MFKKTKAAALGAAGVALLVGSGSTFAMWNQEALLQHDYLELGALGLTVSDFTWIDDSGVVRDRVAGDFITNPGNLVIGGNPDLAAFPLVPGDTVVGRSDVAVLLDGPTLEALLSHGGVTLTLDGAPVPGWISPAVRFRDGGGELVAVGTFTEGDHALTIEVEIAFARGDTVTGRDAEMGRTLDLSQLEVHLTQILTP